MRVVHCGSEVEGGRLHLFECVYLHDRFFAEGVVAVPSIEHLILPVFSHSCLCEQRKPRMGWAGFLVEEAMACLYELLDPEHSRKNGGRLQGVSSK